MNVLTLVISGLSNGSLYALVALGLVLIYKAQDVVNFAHGEFLMVGAFIGFAAYTQLHLPYYVAFAAAIVIGGLLGAVIERLGFRRLAHHHHITLAMVTVGLSVFLKGVANLIYGADIYTLPPAVSADPIVVGGSVVAPQQLLTIGVSLALTLAVFLFFAYTTLGKQMRGTQQSIIGASLVGINTGRIFSFTWVLASALGAVAGVLAAPISLIYPDMGTSFLLKGFAAAILGGFDSVLGAIIGAMAIGVIEMLFGGYVSTAFQQVSSYIILIIVLLFRPHGLFGRQTVKRV
jgi:branched-chain amino acid transport system permease protein